MAGGLAIAGLLAAAAAAAAPHVVLVAASGALLIVLTIRWPAEAVIGFIAVNPFIAGFDRGQVVPYLRLNEVLLGAVLLGLVLVLLGRWARGPWRPSPLHGLDVAMAALTAAGSVLPLLWMYARGRTVTEDDVLYALTLWKYLVLYAAVRLFLDRPRRVRHALVTVISASVVLGLVGVFQALGAGPVLAVLETLLPPGDGDYSLTDARAMASLGNPIAYGAVMTYTAVAAAALALRSPGRSTALWASATVLALCAVASGQISIVLGLLVAGLAFAAVTGTLDRTLAAGLLGLAAAFVVLRPVLSARLTQADPQTGLPRSWTGPNGRLDNLETYFWPPIGADWNWVLGVRTAGRVPGRESWNEWVYIESGYTWAVWTGGLALLAAVTGLLAVLLRTGRRLVCVAEPVTGALGITVVSVGCVLAVMLSFDPHLTLRGGAELLFVLVGMAAGLDAGSGRETLTGAPLVPVGEGRSR